MPFGLCNAAQSMCRLMQKVIPYQLHDRVFVYIDDLLVVSQTFEEHLSLLEDIAGFLRRANLTINLEKSRFCLRETRYLGYIIGGGCIKTDPDKIKAISEYPRPKTPKQIRRFLGMAGWYRRFVQNFSTIAAPLTNLLSKKSKFDWNAEAEEAFDKMKAALTQAPVLVSADFHRTFYIQCDASKTGVGSVLYQKDDEGHDHPIAFMSQKLNAAQRNYTVTELECLAAYLSVMKFKAYVELYQFVIITDHASLRWLKNQKNLSGRLARWSLKLQSFDYDMVHKKGSENLVPDALSRVYMEELSHSDIDPLHIDLNHSAFDEPGYENVREKIRALPPNTSNMCVKGNKIFINHAHGHNYEDTDVKCWKLLVPESLRLGLIEQAHCAPTSAHCGVSKTLDRLRREFFWDDMARDVKNFVSACEVCKMVKPANYQTRPPMGDFHEVTRAWSKVYVDFLGPYPLSRNRNAYIIIALDCYTRYVILKAVTTATAQTLGRFVENEIFLVYGVPRVLVSDNGVQFKSKIIENLLKKYGVKHMFTPSRSPQSNASERVNQSILAAIRAYVNGDHQTWDDHLQEIACALRNTLHSSTGFSPYYLTFGQHYVSHGKSYDLMEQLEDVGENYLAIRDKNDRLSIASKSVLKHLREAYERNANRYNLRARPRKIEIDDTVFVRNYKQSNAGERYSAKLAPTYLKAKVIRKVGNVAFELQDDNGKMLGVYQAKDIKDRIEELEPGCDVSGCGSSPRV